MGSPRSILVAEDEPEVRNLIVEMLSAAGHHVVAAADGEEALCYLTGEQRFDLLLTDVRMPGLSGLDLADEFILAYPGARVLYLTSYPGDVERLDDPRLYGKMLWKPFVADRLQAEVAAAFA
jgi:two-component system, cell cycle response regulator CpdR